MSYLITGATGAIGRQVVNQLVAMGANVHALSRQPDRANLPAAVKVFGGDLTQNHMQVEMFEDVKEVFLFPAEGDVSPFLAKAKAAGVEHLVVLSSLAAAVAFPGSSPACSGLAAPCPPR